MPEHYLIKHKHDFRFHKHSIEYVAGYQLDTNLYQCTHCGAIATSRTLFDMDRMECLRNIRIMS